MPSDDYATAPCPLPDCGSPLHLQWQSLTPIYVSNLAGDGQALDADQALTADWSVVCEEGHTVLLPGPTCPCQDDDCRHEDIDDEEFRTFRAHDAVRLRALIDVLALVDTQPWDADGDAPEADDVTEVTA